MSLHIVQLVDQYLGTTVNTKSYKVLPANVGVIYGDGINIVSIKGILQNLKDHKYSTSCICFGMGGALLQNITRDDQCWAMKACAAKIDGVWSDVKKDPITDSGKVSKAGRMSLFRSRLTGEFRTIRIDQPIDSEWVDVMEVVFENGKLLRNMTFTEVRDNANDPTNSRADLEYIEAA